MTMKRALQAVLGIGLFGLCFSGYLSYHELFVSAVPACPSPGRPGTVLGYPACVYGFFMYLVITAVSGWGLLAGRRRRSEHTAPQDRASGDGARLQSPNPLGT